MGKRYKTASLSHEQRIALEALCHRRKVDALVENVRERFLNFLPVPGHWSTLPLSLKGAANGTTSTEIHRDYKTALVERLYESGATQGSFAKELGITGTQLKTWRLEIEAFGSVEAKRRQQSDAAELLHLRKDHRS